MRAWHAGRYVDDSWTLVAADGELPDGDVVVPLARWQRVPAAAWRGRRVGVVLSTDTAVEQGDAFDPAPFALVAVEFESFSDGRGFSIARTLRRRGFAGDLRALGDVRRDQAAFLLRCGFSSLAVASAAAAADIERALGEITHVYQPAPDGREPIARLRARHRGGAVEAG